MNLEKIITEIYDTAPKQYPAYSSPARKDFLPQSARNTPNFPYQKQDDLTNPPPESVPSIPWPLQTVVDDFADSFVYLATGMNKIASCLRNNPTLKSEQKENLLVLFKEAKKALVKIRNVGTKLVDTVNMAGPQPSQNPVPQPVPPPAESQPNSPVVKIKIK
jgi:hypothetical protein